MTNRRLLLFSVFSVCLFISCGSDNTPSVELNFKLEYDGNPLVMFQDVTYPNGEIMQMKRVSFFVSDMTLSDAAGNSEVVSEVEYLDMTDSHISVEGATEGLSLNLGSTDLTDVNQLRFNVGLNEAQNATVPEDYRSTSPLSRSAEYWRSWESFVFIKLEGIIDYNQNGITDNGESFTLHLGSNAVMRPISLNVNDLSDPIDITIDIRDIFQDEAGEVYDITGEGARLHTLDDPTLVRMAFLTDGLAAAIEQ